MAAGPGEPEGVWPAQRPRGARADAAAQHGQHAAADVGAAAGGGGGGGEAEGEVRKEKKHKEKKHRKHSDEDGEGDGEKKKARPPSALLRATLRPR